MKIDLTANPENIVDAEQVDIRLTSVSCSKMEITDDSFVRDVQSFTDVSQEPLKMYLPNVHTQDTASSCARISFNVVREDVDQT